MVGFLLICRGIPDRASTLSCLHHLPRVRLAGEVRVVVPSSVRHLPKSEKLRSVPCKPYAIIAEPLAFGLLGVFFPVKLSSSGSLGVGFLYN